MTADEAEELEAEWYAMREELALARLEAKTLRIELDRARTELADSRAEVKSLSPACIAAV